jgi:hypothetical protein
MARGGQERHRPISEEVKIASHLLYLPFAPRSVKVGTVSVICEIGAEHSIVFCVLYVPLCMGE